MRRIWHLVQATPKKQWLLTLIVIFILFFFVFMPRIGYAHPIETVQSAQIFLPPHATIELTIGGFCQNRGQPFPGAQLDPIGIVPSEVQAAIYYGVEQGLLAENVYQVQLAVWGLLGSSKPNDSRFELVGQIMDYALGNGAAPTPNSLWEAIEAGAIRVELNDFQSVSSPDYYGTGTLRLTNLSDNARDIAMPYGVLFKDNNQGDAQNIGVFPLAEAVIVSQPGPAGAQGPKGDTGDTGQQGPEGPAGLQGEKGETGSQGEKGDAGPQGVAGAPGPAGLACWDTNSNGKPDKAEDINDDGKYDALDCIGAVGPQGPKGEMGDAGPMGPAGPVGLHGEQGEVGPMGPAGPQGPPGAVGETGPSGLQGLAGLSCWDSNGNQVADKNEDVNGDGDYDAQDCGGPMGAAGAQGLQGETGPMGPPGPMGATGPQGNVGPSGPPGLLNVVTVIDMTPFDDEPSKEISVMCENGLSVLGGGFDVDGPTSDDWIIAVQESYPIEQGWHIRAEAWNARVSRTADCGCDDNAWQVTVWAVCGEKFPSGKG